MEISSMFKDNVTKFPASSVQQNNQVTLESLESMIQTWRSHKNNVQEPIPEEIWDAVFILSKSIPQSKIRTATGITTQQFKRKMQLRQNIIQEKHIENSNDNDLEFCEAITEKRSIPIAYKPAKAFATNTSIVELYRPDGMLMKIHICTDSFNDLLHAFFKGKV